MAVISRPRVAHSSDFSGVARALMFIAMAITAIVVAVPAAIATVG